MRRASVKPRARHGTNIPFGQSYDNERLLTNDLDMNYLSAIQFLRIVTKFKAAKRDRIDISLGKSNGLFQALR